MRGTSALLKAATASAAKPATRILPPNISSISELGKLKSAYPHAHPERFARLKELYKNLPKGDAPKKEPTNLFEWYQQKYIDTESGMPVFHVLAVAMALGYYSIQFAYGHYHPNYKYH